MSNYKRICEFINEFNRNDLFTRKELFEQCVEPYSKNTIDQYRRVFEANNIIVKIKPGIYMKLYDIPEDITYTELVPYIDLGKLNVGKHNVKVKFENTNNIDIVEDAILEVTIEDKNEVKESNGDTVKKEED